MATTNDDQDPSTSEFAKLFAEYEERDRKARRKGGRGPRVGDTVKGRIVSIGSEHLFVDLGGKAEGVVDLAEVRDEEGHVAVQVGDEIEGRVVNAGERDGAVVIRRTLGRGPDAKHELEQAFELGIPVEGVISGVNKGGVEVQMAGLRAFCPISQLDLRHVEDAAPYVGQRHPFRITRFEAGRGAPNVVVSRRALLEEEAAAKASETRARLEVGVVVRGRVTTLKDYGAFVDLGGLEGMLHVSQLGFQRVAHPKDVLSVGQEIEVQVIKIEKSDDPKRPERISLSLKALERDPWSDAVERFPEGARIPGKVARLEPFGAFVELAPGVEGLVHISELGAGRRINHPREVLSVGQEVEVTVLGVDADKRRISLSMAPRDEADAGALAQASAGPKKLGTLGDLLSAKKK